MLCLATTAQDVPKHLMGTNKFDYNGWKVKKGSVIHLSNNDSFIVDKMDWYSLDGYNVMFIGTKLNGKDTSINFNNWVNDGRIVKPNGIAKLEEDTSKLRALNSDEIIGFEPTSAAIHAGYQLMRYAQTQRTGNSLVVGGLLTTLAGSFMLAAGDKITVKASPYVMGGGGALTLIGWVINMSSNKHIANAGRYLNGIVPINHGKKKVIFKEY